MTLRYTAKFKEALAGIRLEGRYRVFANIARKNGQLSVVRTFGAADGLD